MSLPKAPLPELVLLDVYGTLLNMDEIKARINNMMNSKRGYTFWMELLTEYCLVSNCTGRFHDFSSIAAATLQMAARIFRRQISEVQINDAVTMLRHLPIHETAQQGLSVLYNQNFKIAALTNSSEPIVRERMERTGLISYFEEVLSAGQIKKYKPATEVYRWAAEKLNIDPARVLMASLHSWDLAGAETAGMQTAFINHEKQLLYPLCPIPRFVCNNLAELAEQLIALKKDVISTGM